MKKQGKGVLQLQNLSLKKIIYKKNYISLSFCRCQKNNLIKTHDEWLKGVKFRKKYAIFLNNEFK